MAKPSCLIYAGPCYFKDNHSVVPNIYGFQPSNDSGYSHLLYDGREIDFSRPVGKLDQWQREWL